MTFAASLRRGRVAALGVGLLAVASLSVGSPGVASAQSRTAPRARTGAITGRVSLAGRPPGNPVIRMGIDPMCADLNRGRRVLQEQALVDAQGSVTNAFLRLEGSFPATEVPADPVVIDQRACVYGPRVVGVRVGQRLVVRNGDALLHNVHSSSAAGNSFNVGQPRAGDSFTFTPRAPEVMLVLGCDVHRWMKAFVAVMPHPYFAVSGTGGRFEIAGIPPGTYTLTSWHEQFGERTQTVTVRAGAATTADVTYAASGKN